MNKRALTQLYKAAFPSMGVYLIRNVANGRTHVEASNKVEGAINRHQFELRQGMHRNRALQADWREYGAAQFSFEVIDRVKQRTDPLFDHAAELAAMLNMWREEYGRYGVPNGEKPGGDAGASK
ncbi:GIY-YIG nuclease family protein [Ottowia testudinis]|uniref:GIY-YIG nuclease family protein n=1 Tax=Ottowia testudinis TaxID=2816950 RepID=A0A975H6R0_9BURK|nr:GIY-YIG nuclease family protein [Ottowia testudinis]QTD46262.1 GIY-YIG nuclease family protein [Ottowia testudinis]